MAYCDFVVKYNPEVDTQEELTKRIMYSVFIKRIKSKKPVVIFIAGDSGEGKSYGGLKLEEVLCEVQGFDMTQYLHDINVYTPLQYPQKLNRLLFDKELKKVNIICMHEAREVVKAKLWHSFLNQSIGDINAMSRTVKRLIVIIISQFIRDIDTNIRYTLNYYAVMRRPKNKPSRMYLNVLWKDDRDLEKPHLRKRKLSGYLLLPNGKYKRHIPRYFEMSKPKKQNVELFEKADYESKASIIKKKINNLIKEMEADIGKENNKINLMVDWYLKHPENLRLIGNRNKRGWKLKTEIKEMHDLTDFEKLEFEKKLNEQYKEPDNREVQEENITIAN